MRRLVVVGGATDGDCIGDGAGAGHGAAAADGDGSGGGVEEHTHLCCGVVQVVNKLTNSENLRSPERRNGTVLQRSPKCILIGVHKRTVP